MVRRLAGGGSASLAAGNPSGRRVKDDLVGDRWREERDELVRDDSRVRNKRAHDRRFCEIIKGVLIVSD